MIEEDDSIVKLAREGSISKEEIDYYSRSVNVRSQSTGMTALHWAGANRDLALARVLFACTKPPADPWIKDRWGRLAVDLAIETGNQTLIDLFHRHMIPKITRTISIRSIRPKGPRRSSRPNLGSDPFFLLFQPGGAQGRMRRVRG